MKELKNKKFHNFHFFLLSILFHIILSDCEREKPIFKEKNCQLIYCDEDEFSSKICSINNIIIKDQWLTNIIRISDDNFRYINIVFNTKGDMFIETSPISEKSKRIFFGLKKNGRPNFEINENKEETPFYIMNEIDYNLKRHESELINIILNNDENTEFLMSVSVDGYVEIYDFEKDERKYKSTKEFFGFLPLTLINYSVRLKQDNIYYFLFPIYCYDKDNIYGPNYYFYLSIYNFKTIDFTDSNSYSHQLSDSLLASDQKILSCFTTKSLKIGCFFYHSFGSYCLELFNPDFFSIGFFHLIPIEPDPYTFFKAIHLKEEIMAVYYFLEAENSYGYFDLYQLESIDYSYLDYNGYNTIDYYNDYGNIKLNISSLYTSIYYNDLIKLNDNKLCLVSFSLEKKIYIITITLFNNDKDLIIYYYSIDFYNLYNYNIYRDVKLDIYNNFLVFCSSVCRQEYCDENSPIFSTLIIFSYPNCTDIAIDLIDYLSNNNTLIKDFEINLSKYFTIENNLFGYVFKNIKIIKLFEYSHLKIIKKIDSSELSINYPLQENELLNLYYDDEEIEKGEYKIEYAGVVTEPDFNIFIQYPEFNDTYFQVHSDYSEKFEKSTYIGKTTFYIINITEDLISNCLNNCKLCFSNSNCIYKEEEISSSEIFSSINSLDNTNIINSIDSANNIDSTYNINNIKSTNIINGIDSTNNIDSTYNINNIDSANIINNTNRSDIISYINFDSNSEIYNIKSYQNTEIINNSDNSPEITIIKIQNNCSITNIINNECKETINNNQIKDTYEQIKKDILNENYTKQNTVIKTNNAAFQITQYNNQTNNYNISYVDIGICEEKIKTLFNIPKEESLIILKVDIKSEDSSGTYVQYEIYHPYTLEKIDLIICKDISATINTKGNLTNEAILLYDSLKEYGYNFFDSNDAFYNDICSRYTTEYGTDLTLSDRKQLLAKQSNSSLCQKECKFISYNSLNNMVKCNCPIKNKNMTLEMTKIPNINNILFKSFYITLSNSNFRVMKCYKLLFSKEGQINNYGSYILIGIILINIILMLLCFIFGTNELKYFIQIIIKQKFGLKKEKEIKEKNVEREISNIKVKNANNAFFHSSARDKNKRKGKKKSKKSSKKEIFSISSSKFENKKNKKEPPKKKRKEVLSSKISNTKDDRQLNSNLPFNNNHTNIFALADNKHKIKAEVNKYKYKYKDKKNKKQNIIKNDNKVKFKTSTNDLKNMKINKNLNIIKKHTIN